MGKRRITKPSLPNDIIFYHILPRVPSEVLYLWRFACKQWFHWLTNDPGFIDAQLAMSKSKPSFIFDVEGIGYRKKFTVNITFNIITRTITSFTYQKFFINKTEDGLKAAIADSTDFRIYSSCNGLLLLYRRFYEKIPEEEDSIYIVNPDTTQWVTLPRCNFPTYGRGGLGYDPSTKKYKVVHLFMTYDKISSCMSYGCAVLTLGSNNWRRIRYPFKIVDTLGDSLYVNGFLHFRCWTDPSVLMYNTFISMDIANETFFLSRAPIEIPDNYTEFKLGDSLALSTHDSGNLDIWVLQDCCKGIWTKKYSFQKNLQYGCQRRRLRSSIPDMFWPLGAFNDGEGEVVIYQECKGFRLFYYVTWSNELKELSSPWKNIRHTENSRSAIIRSVSHVSTVVSPHALMHNTA